MITTRKLHHILQQRGFDNTSSFLCVVMQFQQSNKRIVKNTGFLYIRMVIVMLVNFYTVRVVMSSLGVVDYGIYSVVCGFVSFFAILNSTLTNTVQRFYNVEIGKGDDGSVSEIYSTAIIIQLTLAIFIVILAECIGLWYINNKMSIPVERVETAIIVFHYSVGALFFLVISIPFSAGVVAYEKMNFMALVGIVDAFLKLLIAFLIKYSNNDKLLLYGTLMMFVSVFDFLLYIFYTKKYLKDLHFKKSFSKSFVKKMLSYSGWMLLDPFSYTVRGQGCNMALNYYYGPVINSAYGVANQAANALESFSINISTSFKPQIIQSYAAGDYERAKKLFYSMSRIIYVLKLLICIPIVLESDYLLHLWLGKDCPDAAIIFTQLLVISGVIGGFAHPITTLITAIGRIRSYMLITSVVVCSILPISIAFLKNGYSANVVFIIYIVAAIINLLLSVLILSKEFESFYIKNYIKVVIIPSVAHLLIVLPLPLLLYHVMESSFVRVCLIGIVCLLVSGLSAYYVVFNKSEKAMSISIIKRIIPFI